jgi:hypothetical protein
VTVYSKCTSALTFENICQADALEAKEKLKTQLDGVMVQLKAAQQRTAFLDQALATAQVTLLKDKENKRRDSSQGDTTIRITSSMSPSQRKKQWEAKETLRLSSNSPSSNSPTTDSLPRWAQEDLKRAQREGGASALAMHHASSAVGGGGGGREREREFVCSSSREFVCRRNYCRACCKHISLCRCPGGVWVGAGHTRPKQRFRRGAVRCWRREREAM